MSSIRFLYGSVGGGDVCWVTYLVRHSKSVEFTCKYLNKGLENSVLDFECQIYFTHQRWHMFNRQKAEGCLAGKRGREQCGSTISLLSRKLHIVWNDSFQISTPYSLSSISRSNPFWISDKSRTRDTRLSVKRNYHFHLELSGQHTFTVSTHLLLSVCTCHLWKPMY